MALRRTPIRKKRSKPRRGQPTPHEKRVLRDFIYELSGGMCELKFPGICRGRVVLPFDGDVRERWHLVHMRAKRRFGWPIDGPHRMRGGCFECHRHMHDTGEKPAGYGD